MNAPVTETQRKALSDASTTDAARKPDASVSLEDRYALDTGRAFMSGIHALVRLPMMQQARDALAGLRTAGFISGYRGSPVGTYDQMLWDAKKYLEPRNIVFQPGVNEELAVDAVWARSSWSSIRPGRSSTACSASGMPRDRAWTAAATRSSTPT